MNLTPFSASHPVAGKHFLPAPKLGQGNAYLDEGLAAPLAYPSPLDCPRLEEDVVGPIGKIRKTDSGVKGLGLAPVSPSNQSVKLGNTGFQRREMAIPRFSAQAPSVRAEFAFSFFLTTRTPARPETLKNAWGIVNSNFAG